MTFKDYIKKVSESTPTKRNVTGPYAKIMYPPAYGLTYRMQYAPDSIPGNKNAKRRKKRKK